MKQDNTIIQSLWIGAEISLLEKLSMASFIYHNHEYHLYVYDDVKGLPDGVIVKDANKIIPEKDIFTGPGALGQKGFLGPFSDFFRHKILFENGSWWVDTDVICIRFFDFDEPYVYSSEYTPTGRQEATTAVMKLPAKSGEAAYCWNHCRAIKDTATINFLDVGPYLIRRSIEKFKNRHFVKNWKTFMPVHWWDVYEFISPNENFRLSDDVYAIHFWNEIWRYHGYDKNARYPEMSIFEQLKRFYNIS